MDSRIDEIFKDPNGGKNHVLPSRIGFGVLDASRTRVEYLEDKSGEPILNAFYVTSKGELVYEIRLGKKSCRVEEFYEGREVGTAIGPTLERAFIQNFVCFGDNPRFRKMIDRITKDRNIELVRPGRNGFRSVYFPEGVIFVMRLPVLPRGRITEMEPKLRDISAHVCIDGVHEGNVIIAGQGRLTHYFAGFVEFIATLRDVEETVDLIFARGLVPQYPQMGLYILDPADAALGSFPVYLGQEGTRIEAYAHLLKRPGDISVIQAEEFIMSDINRMKGMRNGQSTLLN